jgi:hypothetical protein
MLKNVSKDVKNNIPKWCPEDVKKCVFSSFCHYSLI